MTTDSDPIADAVALLRAQGGATAADHVAAIAQRTPPGRTVVVVGEVKRGKSSLVNTLVGHGELSPVDTDIATSAQIRFVPPSPELTDGAAVLLFADGRREPVPVDEVRRWVSLDGDRPAVDDDAEIPIGAEVAAESELLPGVSIVDTPGVNGLDPEHGAAARAAIDGVRVLLMVCDALAPMSAAELDYLREVGADRGSVVVVVTKIDKALREWNTIVSENRALLAKRAPAFADVPVIGVSSLFAQRAAATGSEAIRAASGLDELVRALDVALGDPSELVRTDAGRAALAALDTLSGELRAKLKVILDAPAERGRLTAQLAELEELRATQKQWQARLGQQLTKLTLDHDQRVRTQMDALRVRWEAKLEKTGVVQVSRSAQALAAQAVAEINALTQSLGEQYRDELTAIAVDLLGEALATTPGVADALGERESEHQREERDFRAWKGFFDPQLLTMAMAGGGSITALVTAASIPFLGWAVMPLWAAFAMSFRITKFGRANLTKWVTENSRVAGEDLIAAARSTQNDVAADLRLAYTALLDSSIASTQALVKESEKQATLSAAERNKEAAAIRTRYREVAAVMERLRGAGVGAAAGAKADEKADESAG